MSTVGVEAILNSSFYDKNYSSNNLMRTYELEYPDGHIEEMLDYSDWNYTSIIKRITNFRPYRYRGEKFTTLCFQIYGNTTIYRLVLTFNGYMHPYEIAEGALLNFPDATQLAQLVQDKNIKAQRAGSATSVLI